MSENPIVIKARKALINGGKAFPFILCSLIMFSYIELLFALITNDFIIYDGYTIPNVRLSWLIGEFFEYQLPFVVALTIIVYALKTCVWNKLCCYYSFIALLEKVYFNSIELEIEYVYIVIIVNVIVSILLISKGIKKIKI